MLWKSFVMLFTNYVHGAASSGDARTLQQVSHSVVSKITLSNLSLVCTTYYTSAKMFSGIDSGNISIHGYSIQFKWIPNEQDGGGGGKGKTP